MEQLQELPPQMVWIEEYIQKIKEYIWVRKEDQLLILRPVYTHNLNEMGTFILDKLLQNGEKHWGLLKIINFLAGKYLHRPIDNIVKDIEIFFKDLRTLVDKKSGINLLSLQSVELIPFRSRPRFYPVLSEIAVTYRCNNSCLFCYAHSPYISSPKPELTTKEMKRLLDIIYNDAHVPSVSFTGGEPTLREDLPELIAYAHHLNFRVNLITNGKNVPNLGYAKKLVEAGLNSAQVSLEAGNSELHDKLVNSKGAFQATVAGIKNLKSTGINVHTNSTINQLNNDHLEELVKFIAQELHNEYFSMNALILTGTSLDKKNRELLDLKYSELSPIIQSVIKYSKMYESDFVWYSPACFHYFNPQTFNLGIKQCAACDGLLSLNPYGEIIPCSSFQTPIGPSLLNEGVVFDELWANDAAVYWREKKYLRPECKDCQYEYLCKGACPLYWDAQGCQELDDLGKKSNFLSKKLWKTKRKRKGAQYGTSPKKN